MDSEILYQSEYIILSKSGNNYFIQSLKAGMGIQSFNEVLQQFPQIKITDFMKLKNILMAESSPPVKFGEGKPRVHVDISADKMRATLTLNVEEAELKAENQGNLYKEIKQVLDQLGIVEGIKLQEMIQLGALCNGKQILVAEGTKPTHGEDSTVHKYYSHDPKPIVNEDDSVNFYELNLINQVAKGSVLAEWSEPTMGIPGKNVMGEVIEASVGNKITIPYDENTIYEEMSDGFTRLIAIKDGAAEIKNNILTVEEHLEIAGNVDFKTGNIHFDGYVTIKGSVEDRFSVIATKNIEILSADGLGSVKEIISTEGSIFIKGGVNGREKTLIQAKQNVFIKYAKDAIITCEGMVNIGAYAFNCNIRANQIVVEAANGHLVGGKSELVSRVNCATIGSVSEIPTEIYLSGIDRMELNLKAAALHKEIDDVRMSSARLEKELNAMKGKKLNPEEKIKLKIFMQDLVIKRNSLKELEQHKKELQDILKIRGDCEIITSKHIFPHTVIHMKTETLRIRETQPGKKLFFENGEIMEG